jgi:hypothetical protein
MSDPSYYVLSEDNIEVLRAMAQAYRSQQGGAGGQGRTLNRPAVQEHLPCPRNIYLAVTPGGGIPASSSADPSSATLGSASCQIYQLVNSGGTISLIAVYAYTQTVYNYTTTAVPGSTMTLVAQDNYGQWFLTGVTGGGGSTPSFVGCSLTNATQTFASGSNTALALSNTPTAGRPIYDTSSFFNPSVPHQVIIPSAGYYQVSARLDFGQLSSGNGSVYVAALNVTQSNYFDQTEQLWATFTGIPATQVVSVPYVNGIVYCSAGDVIQIFCLQYQTTGANFTMGLGVGSIQCTLIQ